MANPATSNRLIGVHTSDRILFKRCRRKWDLSSHLRQGYEPADAAGQHSALWFGTAFHFVLEDYHGLRRFPTPEEALQAYVKATNKSRQTPPDHAELYQLGLGMLQYYTKYWLPRRREFKTLVLDGIPQVEVEFEIPLPGTGEVYAGAFDRVVTDPHGRYWVIDYKTRQRFDTAILPIDPQVSAYTWAAQLIYGVQFEGVIIQQHLKSVPHPPVELKTGGFSVNKNQATTYEVFKEGLKAAYDGKIPVKYKEYLEYLISQEGPEGDKFIRRDLVRRNPQWVATEAVRIMSEAHEMLTIQSWQIQPNPTRDCNWDCPFREVCISMDDGSDWESLLRDAFVKKREIDRSWRKFIQYPDDPNLLLTEQEQREAELQQLLTSE